jgi:ankyrin repeat domain-containing protein 50
MGADVNAQGGLFGNALQAVSHNGHDRTIEVLLGKGANINTVDMSSVLVG